MNGRRLFGALITVALLGALIPATTVTVGAAPLVVTVSPTTDLVDGQSIHVTVTGLAEFDQAWSLVCAAVDGGHATDRCTQTQLSYWPAGASGEVGYDVGVDAVFGANDGTAVDCRVAPGCALVTRTSSEASVQFERALAFRANGPLIPPASLAVTPAVDFVDGQIVHVAGASFGGTSTVEIDQCRAAMDSSADCAYRSGVTAASDGSFSTDLRLDVVLDVNDGTVVDCRLEACQLVASRQLFITPERHQAGAPLVFRPDGPLRPPPVLAVTPSTGLVDGQQVSVSGSRFNAGSVAIGQCVAGTGSVFERCPGYHFFGVDETGLVTTTVSVAVVEGLSTASVDCRKAPGCTIVAFDVNDHVLAETPIAFKPASPPPPPPPPPPPHHPWHWHHHRHHHHHHHHGGHHHHPRHR